MQGTVVSIIIALSISGLVAWLWVRGIDNMKKEHPNYKGEDFLDWDDNKVHSEGTF